MAALLDFPRWGRSERRDKDSHTPYPNTICSCFCDCMGCGFFGRFDKGTVQALMSLLNIGDTKDVKLCMVSLVRSP